MIEAGSSQYRDETSFCFDGKDETELKIVIFSDIELIFWKKGIHFLRLPSFSMISFRSIYFEIQIFLIVLRES